MSGQVVEIEELCDKPNTFTFPPFIDPDFDPTIQSTTTFEAKLGESGKFQVTSADTQVPENTEKVCFVTENARAFVV